MIITMIKDTEKKENKFKFFECHNLGGGGGGGWRGYLPIYGVVRMCGPNSPLFQLGKYMNGPTFSQIGK